MFRRLSNTLPKDPEFPADFEKLGHALPALSCTSLPQYFINSSDQIRSITHPTQGFHFNISKNERACEVQREAFNTCICNNLLPRFQVAGLQTTRLSASTPIASPNSIHSPIPSTSTGAASVSATTTTPVAEEQPHVPILTTTNLSTASRILLYFGERTQDLGVYAYRAISKQSLASGSVLELVTSAIKTNDPTAASPSSSPSPSTTSSSSSSTAVVIANPGQLIWHRRGARAMTLSSWNALPRKTGVDSMMRLDPVKNRVTGHHNMREHVESVVGFVRHQMMAQGAKLEIIGVAEGAEEIVHFLDRNWDEWGGKVAALCVGLGFLWRVLDEVKSEGLKEFWGKRARAYLLHSSALGTPLYGREVIGCNCYSSGENQYVESIMPNAYTEMLEFFQLVHTLPGFEEKPLLVEQEGGQDDDADDWEVVTGDQRMVKGMQEALVEATLAD